MNLTEEELAIYQSILVKDYRKHHEEETMYLTDEEVSLMCPISLRDAKILKSLYLTSQIRKINEQINELNESIVYDNGVLNDPKTFHEMLPELRTDIRMAKTELAKCSEILQKLNKELNLINTITEIEDLEDTENEQYGSR
jgi:septal ring factor EnvC (AmiA/AmiB activator)